MDRNRCDRGCLYSTCLLYRNRCICKHDYGICGLPDHDTCGHSRNDSVYKNGRRQKRTITIVCLHNSYGFSFLILFPVLHSRVKQNRNCRSFVLFTFYRNLSVVKLYRMLYDRQTEASTTRLLGMTLIDTVKAFQ